MSRARRVVAVLLVATSHALVLPTGHAWAATDPLRSQQWALTQIGAPDAWSTATGRGVTIGVIDTGVDLGHEDLAGKIVDSTTCIGSSGDPDRCSGDGQDDFGHGTHVAGIAAAVADNGVGIAGVAPDARLLVVRALAKDGDGAAGKAADIVAGVRWVVDRGAKVVNLSLGTDPAGSDSPTLLADGISYAWSHGAVPVLAAGNGGRSGALPDYGGLNALVVGASDREGRVSSYSSSLDRAKWGLIAPGGSGSDTTGEASSENIVSAWWDPRRPNRYAVGAGTSMAAPHVAGAAALLMSLGLDRDETVAKILDTADDSIPCGTGCHGRLDVARAVAASVPAHVTEPAVTTTEAGANVSSNNKGAAAPASSTKPAPPPTPATTRAPSKTPARAIGGPPVASGEPSSSSTTTAASGNEKVRVPLELAFSPIAGAGDGRGAPLLPAPVLLLMVGLLAIAIGTGVQRRAKALLGPGPGPHPTDAPLRP